MTSFRQPNANFWKRTVDERLQPRNLCEVNGSAVDAGLRERFLARMSAPERYDDEIVISWPELHRDARYLSQLLHDRGTWQGIVAITRGGLVPAALVARELEIRLIDTICVSSYVAGTAGGAEQQQSGVKILKTAAGDGEGFLLIDDLVDTGRTAQVVRQLLPKACFATLYAKPAGRPYVDTCVKEFKQNKWIYFPWDIEYRFAKPIRDGGRAGVGAVETE